jgi:hypothetical protein
MNTNPWAIPLRLSSLVLLVLLGAAGCRFEAERTDARSLSGESAPDGGVDAAPLPFTWPTSPGWTPEEDAFPLPWAPSLPYAGVAELRFSPGWGDPKSDEFWSYAFVWLLDGQPDLSKDALEAAMVTYFRGLADGNAKDGGAFDPSGFRAHLTYGYTRDSFVGTIDTYEFLVSGAPLRLNVEIVLTSCGSGKLAAKFLLSPRAAGVTKVWNALRDTERAFTCS